MNIISKKQIVSVKDEAELRSFFIDSSSKNTISDDTQPTVLLQCIKYDKMGVLEDLSKNVKFKKNILDEIIEYPEMLRRVILSNGMGGVISQLSNKQLLQMIDNLIDSIGEYDVVWTHLYQKTFKHKTFKNNQKQIKLMLDYLVFEKKHSYFSKQQIIMNIVETMRNITPDLIEWVKKYGKNVDNIILNLLYKNGSYLEEDILEYIYIFMYVIKI